MTEQAGASVGAMIVDDEDDIRRLVRVVIDTANMGLFVRCEAASGPEALANIDACAPAVVVLDLMMPELSGIETADRIRARHPDLPIVLFSAFLTNDVEAAATEAGVNLCLSKTDVSRLPEVLRGLAA